MVIKLYKTKEVPKADCSHMGPELLWSFYFCPFIWANISINLGPNEIHPNQGSVGGAVIQATWMAEFDDGLRTGVLQESDTARPWKLALTKV